MSDGTRERILLRRARFVTAALSGLTACSKVSEAPRADPSTKPLPPVSASPSAQPEAELPADLPPLATPSGVSEMAKEQYERLAKQVRSVHEHLARAANAIPSCKLDEEECKKAFRAVADHLVVAEQTIDELGPRCPGSSKEAKAVDARVDEHLEYARERLQKIRKRVTTALDAQGTDAGSTWEEIVQASVQAHPQPCLKFACPEW